MRNTPTIFGTAKSPTTDNSANVGPTATITPPGSMTSGQLVVVIATYRGTTETVTVGTTGGQSWSNGTQNNTSNLRSNVFWCVFNGTWGANPAFTVTTGTNAVEAYMVVLDLVDMTTGPFDVAVTNGTDAGADTTIDISDFSTTNDHALAFNVIVSQDNNSYSTFTGGWSQPEAQWRVTTTTGLATTVSYKAMAVAGAVGAFSAVQSAVGPDAAVTFSFAILGTLIPSTDRAVDEPFRTRRTRSKRSLTAAWLAAFAGPPAPPAVVPAAAWAPVKAVPRRSTARRLVVPPKLAATPLAPSNATVLIPPKSIRIAFRPKLIKQSPQILYPPSTGPPAQPLAAWALPRAFSFWQDRKLLTPLQPGAFPPTPHPEPNLAARIPVGFRHRNPAKRKALAPKLSYFAPPPAGTPSPDRGVAQPFTTKRKAPRRLPRTPDVVGVGPAAPSVSQAPVSAWTKPEAFRNCGMRKLQQLPTQPVFPATPAPAQPVSAWELRKSFARPDSHRRALKPLELPSAPSTTPAPPQPLPAWALKTAKWRYDAHRRALAPIPPPSTPATPSAPAQPLAAWLLKTSKWRADRHRRALIAVQPASAPQTPGQPFAAWKAPTTFFVSQERRLLVPRHEPLYRQTPVITEPFVSWKLATSFRRHGRMEIVVVPLLLSYPPSTAKGYLVASDVRIIPAMSAIVQITAALDGDPAIDIALDGAPRMRPTE